MARRVSWTNNSSGHSGTYVYRAPTIDPQTLPAPVATVDPVAQGETAEWVDNDAPYECYAVQDFDGQGAGTLSAEVCIANPLDTAQIGDAVEGGIYAGIITYADSRQFHLIAANEDASARKWNTTAADTPGANSTDDGLANTEAMVTAGISEHPAGQYCVNYVNEGYDDWYMPATNELIQVSQNLSTITSGNRWASRQVGGSNQYGRVVSASGSLGYSGKTGIQLVRPIRRVAA